MDTHFWLAEEQIKPILNGHKVELARQEYKAVKWAHNWWYPVASLPLTNPEVSEAVAQSMQHPHIVADSWVPMAEVLEYWPYSRQRFFQVVEQGAIERTEVTLGKSPFWVYNKADIQEYIQVHAVEGRLRKAVQDIDAYMETVEKW